MRQIYWLFITLGTILWFLHTLSSPMPAAAQPPPGSIRGKVVDAQTGEPLTGAYVFLNGTKLGAVCDVDGAYTISNVAPGTYVLTSSMIGYNRVTAEKVVVREGAVCKLDFSLQPEAIATGEVVVEAQALRNAASTTRTCCLR